MLRKIILLISIALVGVAGFVLEQKVRPNRVEAQAIKEATPSGKLIRDRQRQIDINLVVDALYRYAYDNNADFPPEITHTTQELGTCALCVDLNEKLVPVYLPIIPFDPRTGSKVQTGYFIHLDSYDRLVASASSELRHLPMFIIR